MSKRIYALILTLSLLSGCAVYAADGDTVVRKTAEAAYGTPVIDGEADSVWDKTNYYTIEQIMSSDKDSYKGWFKLLWDENHLYLLTKIYTSVYNDTDPSPWRNDSVELFVDEKCDRTTKYGEDDYQLRSDFNAVLSGMNYDLSKLDCKTKITDDGYIAEMKIPLLTITAEAGMEIGYDMQVNASATLSNIYTQYRWSRRGTALSSNNSEMGTARLLQTVKNVQFDEPEYTGLGVAQYVDEYNAPDEYKLLTNVTTKLDGAAHNVPILLINEYPAMEINDLAGIIGGETLNSRTLKKDSFEITYEEGNRLAADKNGHLMLERRPVTYEDRFYVPISSILPSLYYRMEYNRFENLLEIFTGTNYPQEAEVVIRAKDYGAVGDGVHYDGAAITRALNAALNSGKPSRLELEAGATYLIEERNDNWNYFLIEDAENFTFEGNGSTILFDRPNNSFIQVMRSKNIKVRNMTVDYKVPKFTQGEIVSIDAEGRKFRLLIEDGYPLPANDEWVHYLWTNARTGGWFFGQIMDRTEQRMKFVPTDHFFIDKVSKVEGRLYELSTNATTDVINASMEVGDRFVLNTRSSEYDIPQDGKGGSESAIYVDHCADVEFDGIFVYTTSGFYAGLGLNDGRIYFRNGGEVLKPGTTALNCGNTDGIHSWLNRGGIVIENCTFMNNLDDQLNTKSLSGQIISKESERSFVITQEMNPRVGDELLFFDPVAKKVLGRAYLKEYQSLGGGRRLYTIDRDIDNVLSKDETSLPTIIMNLNTCDRNAVIRGNKYLNSRRHAYINRTPNVLFENNEIVNAGGSAMAAMNELVNGTGESPFPSSNTMRNNTIKGDGMTYGYYPLSIKSWDASLGASAAIDGFLLENNTFDVPNELGTMRIDSVNDLYMINNTIKSSGEVKPVTMPAAITNSDIELIDGLNVEYAGNVSAAVTIAGCKVNEENLKNIKFLTPNTGKEYVIEK